jgi:glycosidase
MMVNFIDNHDVARFLYRGDVAGLHVALSYLLTTIGVPSLYYGTEQQYAGGNDPGNREVLWRGNPLRSLPPYDTSNETFQHIKTLNQLRATHAPLRRGDYTIRWASASRSDEDASDAGIYAFERTHEGETVLVVLNAARCTATRKTSTTSAHDTLMETAFAEGTTLQNVLPDEDGPDQVTVQAGQKLEITVPCRSSKIFVKK